MLRTFRPLATYNPDTLAAKAAALAAALGAPPERAGALLARAPRALGASAAALDDRIDALEALVVAAAGNGDDAEGLARSAANSGGSIGGGESRGAGSRRPLFEAEGSATQHDGASGGDSGNGGGGGSNPRAELLELLARLPWLLTLAPAQLNTRLDLLSQALGAPRAEVGGGAACMRARGDIPGLRAAHVRDTDWGAALERVGALHSGGAFNSRRAAARRAMLAHHVFLHASGTHFTQRSRPPPPPLPLCRTQVARAVLRHPRLLQSSNQLPQKLRALAELLQLEAAADDAGTGVANRGSTAGGGNETGSPATAAALSAAAALALRHPELLCFSPRALALKFSALQAACGLPAAEVGACVREHPRLLAEAEVDSPEGGGAGGGGRGSGGRAGGGRGRGRGRRPRPVGHH